MKCEMCDVEIDGVEVKEDYNIYQDLYPKLNVEDKHVCKKCGYKVRLDKKIEEYKPAIEQIFDRLNKSSFSSIDKEAIVSCMQNQHRYLQNEAMLMIYDILFRYGKNSGDVCWEDARNAWGLAWAKAASSIELRRDGSGTHTATLRKD